MDTNVNLGQIYSALLEVVEFQKNSYEKILYQYRRFKIVVSSIVSVQDP